MKKNKPSIKVRFGKSFAEKIEFGWRIVDPGGGCHMASWHERLLIEALIRSQRKVSK